MTRGIWGDPERYLDTYWSRWPGVWVHGDWASIDEDGYWFLHGRSRRHDQVAGKRLGPGRGRERARRRHPAVAESRRDRRPDEVKGEAIWCFVVLKPGVEEGGLATALRNLVADHLGRSFLPSKVVFVPELPKTRSAKIVRRAIRAAALGKDPGDVSSLENPDALESIRRALER